MEIRHPLQVVPLQDSKLRRYPDAISHVVKDETPHAFSVMTLTLYSSNLCSWLCMIFFEPINLNRGNI